MDTLTLIATALVLGVSAGVKDTAASAARDAYSALKGLIVARFERSSDTKGIEVFADFESDPDTYEKPLIKHLQLAKVDEDAEIVRQARALTDAGAAAGLIPKFTVVVSGNSRVGIIGDSGQIATMN